MKLHLSKKLIIILSAILLVIASVGSTLAYIIAKTPPAENEFDRVKVSCLVVGNFDNATNINATVKNTGDISAYVRAVIVVNWVSAENGNIYGSMPIPDVDYKFNFGSGKWTKSADGFYYYSEPVKSTGVTDTLITSVETLSTAPDGYKLSVQIVATAVQSSPSSTVEGLWDVDVLDNGNIYVGN